MKKNSIHKIVYIDETGKAIDKKELRRVIFIGENKILEKIKFKRTVFPIIMLTFIFTLFFSGYKIYTWKNDGLLTSEKVEDYIDIANIEENEVTEDLIVETVKEEKKVSLINNSYYWKFNNVKMMNVKFDNLLKINEETVAWLYVPGTKVNYPVVHHNNNDFYLDRTFDKSKNSVGWVFLDYRNDGTLKNKNNVIYAHGRLDNIMFGTLKNVLKRSWYTNESNKIVKTSTPTHNDLWEVFSVYSIKSEKYYITTGFASNLDYYNFIDTITKRSLYDYGVVVSTTDNILTLSTCLNDFDDRVVLHARLIAREEKVKKETNEEVKSN